MHIINNKDFLQLFYCQASVRQLSISLFLKIGILTNLKFYNIIQLIMNSGGDPSMENVILITNNNLHHHHGWGFIC